MNLSDYPTPKTDAAYHSTWGDEDLVESGLARKFEREAAAWRAVAEKYKHHHGDYELAECDDAFDALKAEVEGKP